VHCQLERATQFTQAIPRSPVARISLNPLLSFNFSESNHEEFINLGTRWRWVVNVTRWWWVINFTHLPLYPRYPLNRRLQQKIAFTSKEDPWYSFLLEATKPAKHTTPCSQQWSYKTCKVYYSLLPIVKSREVHRHTKIRLNKTITRSVLWYSSVDTIADCKKNAKHIWEKSPKENLWTCAG
jgi:hypothetical protein